MYKILIRNRDDLNKTVSKIEKFSFYRENSIDYETGNLLEALEKMNDLLDMYLRKDIKLVEVIETNTETTSSKLQVVKITNDMYKLINDGVSFQFRLDLSLHPDYTIIDIDNKLFEPIKTYLEELGLENVKITPGYGITANNPTEKPVIGSFDAEKGMLMLYSRATKTNNYISSGFYVQIKATDSLGVIIETGPYDDSAQEVYFIDDNGNLESIKGVDDKLDTDGDISFKEV